MEKKDNPPPYSPYPPPPQAGQPPGFVPPPGNYGAPPPGVYPPQSYPQPAAPGPNIVIQHQVTTITPLGPESVTMVCPSCRQTVRTTVETKPTTKTHLFAILLCLFGCWPCFCLPYCMDSCQRQEHTCPNCGAYIGVYDSD